MLNEVDTNRNILTQASDRPLILIGHSLGGLVLQQVIFTHSSRVSPGCRKAFILDLWNLAFFLYGKQGSEGGDPAKECMWRLLDQAR
jgi:pimeloyl-ACP methyl ester carboxylesterase